MSSPAILTEFYLKIDRECQEWIDKSYKIISELSHYEGECNFKLPEHIKRFKQTVFQMLKTYEENQL